MADTYCALYFCDEGLHQETLFSIASLAKATQTPLDIVFIQANYGTTLRDEYLSYLKANGCRLNIRSINYVEDKYWRRETPPGGERHHRATSFHKIDAIESVLESYEWIFYLDGDVLFFEDPKFESLIGFREAIGACHDVSRNFGIWNNAFVSRCQEFGVSTKYFNAGFLCFNARRWYELDIRERYREMALEHAKACPYFERCRLVDQCVWNMIFDGQWHPFDICYNVQASCIHSKNWGRAIMRHYTGLKPKFLPIRNRRCDRRENGLLRELNSECRLGMKFGIYDYGVFYALNCLRRRAYCKSVDKYLEQLDGLIALEATSTER